MVRTYKPKALKMIGEIIGGLFLAGFIFIVRFEPILTDKSSPIVAAVILVLSILLALSSMRIRIEVTDEELIAYRGKKVARFPLETHRFGSKTNNSGSQDIIVYLPNGNQDVLDCQFLSEKDFNRLTDDLAITGPKQQAVKITVREKSVIEE